MVAGVALGLSRADGSIGDLYSSIDSRQVTVSPYMRMDLGPGLSLSGRVFASTEDWSYERTAGAATASANVEGKSFGGKIELAKDLRSMVSGLGAYAGLSYSHTDVDGYTGGAAGAANLVVPSYDIEKTDIHAGLRRTASWTTVGGTLLNGFLGAGVGANLSSDSSILTSYAGSGTDYSSIVENDEGAYATLEFGLSGEVAPGVTIAAAYGGRFSDEGNEQSAMLRISASF
ncbi:autotransporter outer membrane beta-barrel domain-containing protein [Cereibacter changlensis]|uniref:autotransporter outer membrane beta-barrel domain-containing protein n=1 Tax=Cereibacter changlensis TaxID=402884 RepID=UPI004033C3DE